MPPKAIPRPRHLARLQSRVQSRLPEGWYDLRTRAGLANGILSMSINVVQFSLILLLLILLDATGGGRPSTWSILVLPAAIGYGIGIFYAYQTSDRLNRGLREFPTNYKIGIPLQLFTYGSYAALVTYHSGLGVLAAAAYLAGKACILGTFFLPAELRR